MAGVDSGGNNHTESAIQYWGFHMIPKNAGGGWSTEAVISKQINGEVKSHHFIRADQTNSRQSAIALATAKARIVIDQSGENIFAK